MNDMENVKRRVKKLLALSKSPNENEALMDVKMANNIISQYQIEENFNGVQMSGM